MTRKGENMPKKIPQSQWHSSQRGYFAGCLYNEMLKNKSIILVVGDLGYGVFNRIRDDFPDQFYNVGASEQAALGICVGLALEGKIPIFYSITTFLLYRGFETIRNYIHYEKIPVKLVGSGRNKDYAHDGISHWPLEDQEVLKIFSNIEAKWPNSSDDLPKIISEMLENKKPYYINLKR